MQLTKGHINTLYSIRDIEENEEGFLLNEYGIVEGASIKILKKAAFKGPYLIEINNSKIAVRRDQASLIKVII